MFLAQWQTVLFSGMLLVRVLLQVDGKCHKHTLTKEPVKTAKKKQPLSKNPGSNIALLKLKTCIS